MRKVLFTLTLITIKLLALDVPHTGDILSSLEGHIDMLSPYSVNVGHGDFVQHEIDYILQSPEPIIIERIYDSLQHSNNNDFGQWYTHPECMMYAVYKMSGGKPAKGGYFIVPEPCGATLEYKHRDNFEGSPKVDPLRWTHMSRQFLLHLLTVFKV